MINIQGSYRPSRLLFGESPKTAKTPNQVVNEAMLEHYPALISEKAVSEYLTEKGCSFVAIQVVVKKLKNQQVEMNTNVLDEAGVKFSKEEADAALLYFQRITPIKKKMNEVVMGKLLRVYDPLLSKQGSVTLVEKVKVKKVIDVVKEATGIIVGGQNINDFRKFDGLKAMGIDFTEADKQVILEYKRTYDALVKENPLVVQYEIKAGGAQQRKSQKMTPADDFLYSVLEKAVKGKK